MSDKVLSGAPKLMAKLKAIAKSMGGGKVSIGFMEGATYPDGTPVAAVAFWNEFGASGPPRPFFRQMIAKESPSWGYKMAKLAKATDYQGQRVLGMMGEDIGGALVQSIVDFTTPGNADSTIARKGFDKPLTDTNHMKRSVYYRVDASDKVRIKSGD